MKYHVVTPFSRFQNMNAMGAVLQRENVHWILLVDAEIPVVVLYPKFPCQVFRFPHAEPFWRAWRNHLNAFIKLNMIEDGDRYIILNDDDFVEPGFFKKLDAVPGEFLICSMKRGQHTPSNSHGHGTDTLMACPENVKVCHVGCEQMIVSGRLFKTIHFADDICADGMAIVELAKRHPPAFVPDAYVWFNYLEPGRWGK